MQGTQRSKRFRQLHEAGTFLLPNAWDAVTTAMMERAGAPAVGTTSSGISWAHGVPDGEALGRDAMAATIRRMVAATSLPVTADVEAGYGPSPADVARTLEEALGAGAAGANLEDRLRSAEGPLWPLDAQCERLAAAREAADRGDPAFVLNARTDVFLAAVGPPDEREDHVVQRAVRYHEAGADCLFVPGLADLIARLVRRCPVPLNVLLAPGTGPSIRELARAGVRRISVGHLLASASCHLVESVTRRLLDGDASGLEAATPHAELQALMGRPTPGPAPEPGPTARA